MSTQQDDSDQAGLPYPAAWETDVALRDGRAAHLRPIRPDDKEGIERFHAGQSPQSIYYRFFSAVNRLTQADLHRFTHVDHRARVAFVITLGEDIIGIGRYERLDAESAEVAFNVSDAHQGRGLGTVLLEHLAAAARENGFSRFVAEVLPANRKMLNVFREAGYEVRSTLDDGVIYLDFDLDPTDASLEVMQERERSAEARSMRAVLAPTSIVVVGASRRPQTLGHRLLVDVLQSGFTGAIHVVHPDADEIMGQQTVAQLSQVPGPVDLALVAVPASALEDVVAECAVLGVRAMVVFTRGLAEVGAFGPERQLRLVQKAHAQGMRVVGPASWGVLNTDPAVRLNASLAGAMPAAGRFGAFNQSGALSHAVVAEIMRGGVGISSFVSAGHRADVSGNDCMQYWSQDPNTDVVGLYLESLGNPRKFFRVARRLAREKPVIVLKPGSSGFGVPPGHAVRPSQAPPAAFEALLRSSGCVRVRTLHQMVDTARFLLNQPLPRPGGVAIIGNSDALAAMLADACLGEGLQISFGPSCVSPDSGAKEFAELAAAAAAQPGVASVVAGFVPDLATGSAGLTVDSVRHLVEAAVGPVGLPAALCAPDLGWTTAPAGHQQEPQDSRVPVYGTPEEVARVVGVVAGYSTWRRRDHGSRVAPEGTNPRAARNMIKQWLAAAGDSAAAGLELNRDQSTELLAQYGIDLWPALPAPEPETAIAAADLLGWPVALKSTDQHLQHRLDLGGVRLDVMDAAELRTAMAMMKQRLRPSQAELVVQKMAPPGETCLIRTAEDSLYGPILSFALGGDAHDLAGDVAFGVPPMTDTDVADLVRSVRMAPKLFGYRGTAAVDIAALEDLVGRVSRMADDLPALSELELNPVVVSPSGAAVLSVRIVIASAPARTDAGRRELLSPASVSG